MGNGTSPEARRLPTDSPQAGEVRRGAVSEITDFGVLIDLAGHEGLVNTLEVSWKRFGHPSQVVQVGQEVTALVLGMDSAHGIFKLSLKALTPDPMLEFARTKLGEIVPGRISAVNPVGIFAEVHEGLEGLIISQEPPAEDASSPSHLKPGDEVSVRVLSVNLHTRQIALSRVGSN